MVLVYSESIQRRYYATSRFSCAYFFILGLTGVAIVLPFFLAYTAAPSFWLKTHSYREQPELEYEYKAIVLLHGLGADGLPMQLFFSSATTVNNFYEADVRVPLVRSTRLDTNRDGLIDRFHFEAIMPLQPEEQIYDASVALFFDTKLRRRARIEFETLVYADASSALPGSGWYCTGELALKQQWPFKAKGGFHTPYRQTPLLDPDDVAFEQTLLPRLVAAYSARNETLDLDARYSLWSSAVATPKNVQSTSFNMTLDFRVPVVDVLYTPTATEVLKAAWIKYLSLFVVVYYLLDKLAAFVFFNQLVDSEMVPAAFDPPK